MPFRSAKQRAYLHAKEPALAKKWDAETGGKIVKTPKAPAIPKIQSAHIGRGQKTIKARGF